MSVALPPHSELAYVRQQRLDIADEQLGRVVKIGGKLPDLLVDAERPDAYLNLGAFGYASPAGWWRAAL